MKEVDRKTIWIKYVLKNNELQNIATKYNLR